MTLDDEIYTDEIHSHAGGLLVSIALTKQKIMMGNTSLPFIYFV